MREIAWVRAARKEFETFPEAVRNRIRLALEVSAHGRMADNAKPLKGFDGGVFEIAVPYRTDAYRAVYAVRTGAEIWVIHAFQKKSTKGIATQKRDIDLVHARLRQLSRAGST